jgi:hypothetical protein
MGSCLREHRAQDGVAELCLLNLPPSRLTGKNIVNVTLLHLFFYDIVEQDLLMK